MIIPVLILLALLLAWRLRRMGDRAFTWLMGFIGLLFASTEILKQLYLYQAGGGRYNWWYFPFQLCSIPMYLCLLYPLCRRGRGRRLLCTFMYNFNLLGAIAVFFDTSGLYHDSLLLTIHSFGWHILIIFLGSLILFSRRTDVSWAGYGKSLALFLALCLMATGFNILFHPFGDIDMFYITPYYPSIQIIFHSIALRLGTIPGDLIYVGAIAAGAALFHLAARRWDAWRSGKKL